MTTSSQDGVATRQACSCLRKASDVARDDLTPDLLIKAVPDLDNIFFQEVLQDRITVEWAAAARRADSHVARGTYVPGLGGKSRIVLNRAMFRARDVAVIWRALLHELLHAYLGITSGDLDASLCHGKRFKEMERAIWRRLEVESRIEVWSSSSLKGSKERRSDELFGISQ